MSFHLGNKSIGINSKPFIIAEMSGNHNQSLDRALKIVEAAAMAGADAIKLQTYTADTMTINIAENEFLITDPHSLWYGKNLYELYQEAHTPWEWHHAIFKRCQELGIICFSTPFDESAVDFLETLNAPIYKIASFENTDIPLLKKVAQTKKPVIISTGMTNLAELEEIVTTLKNNGCENIVLLKCTSTYPAEPSNSNIATIPHLKEMFNVEVGLSDHTLGIGVAIASIALGATVIEKHFTLCRADGGVDSAFSLEPQELKMLVDECQRAQDSIGKVQYFAAKDEEISKVYRRSLYVVQDIKKGETFNSKNIRNIRPGLGLPPKYIYQMLGKKAKYNIKRGTPCTLDQIE